MNIQVETEPKYFLDIFDKGIFRRRVTATPEQVLIIEAAVQTKDNLLISALAGAAKTSTLEFICKYMPVAPMLSIAFNKRIAEEMAKRLPGHVQCSTINSIGHRVWMKACSKRLVLDTKKSYNVLSTLVKSMPKRAQQDAYEDFAETLRLIAHAKLNGYIPEGVLPHVRRLIPSEDFWASLEEEATELQVSLVDQVLEESIKMAYNGQIDFDDQIYMPTLFGGTFPKFPLVMVDEAQDLSPLNHAMLAKLVTERLIAVGDPWQSIYGFRGAVHAGMSRLQHQYNMREMPLSISFRCPISIVERARFRAPHMQWPQWAIQGEIHEIHEEWTESLIPDNAAVICRNNAPLFSCALRLLRRGRGIQLVGSDLGPGLVKVLKKLGPEYLDRDKTLEAINRWETERLRKARNEGPTRDRAECLRVFAGFGDTLGAAIAYAERLFSSAGPIQLLSGHKAKGLEWDTVFHLDPWRIPSRYAIGGEALEQELNVRYVIETRAKEKLYLVNLEDFQ